MERTGTLEAMIISASGVFCQASGSAAVAAGGTFPCILITLNFFTISKLHVIIPLIFNEEASNEKEKFIFNIFHSHDP